MYEIPRTRREGSSPPARSTCNVSKIGEEPTHLESLLPPSFSFALNRCSMSCAASNLMGAITGAPIPFSHDENDLRLMGLMALSPPDRLNDLSTLLNVVVTSSLWIDIFCKLLLVGAPFAKSRSLTTVGVHTHQLVCFSTLQPSA